VFELAPRSGITALFCDLRGFTGFSESSDPEDVMALLREYHAAIGEIIIRYSGTLERYAGDGVMVVFNDPIPVDSPALQVRSATCGGRKRRSLPMRSISRLLGPSHQRQHRRRGRLARARAAVKRHPQYNEHEYFLAVEAAFEMWEAKQTGR
jgi:class 3 adenylate cyclase